MTLFLIIAGFFVALVLAFGVVAVACAMAYRIGLERGEKLALDRTGHPMPPPGQTRGLRSEKALTRENGASGG